jgi:hypothetical protein
MTRRFPSRRQIRADELGADELMAQLEWVLRDRPQALRNARACYRKYCNSVLARIERFDRKRLNQRTRAT